MSVNEAKICKQYDYGDLLALSFRMETDLCTERNHKFLYCHDYVTYFFATMKGLFRN